MEFKGQVLGPLVVVVAAAVAVTAYLILVGIPGGDRSSDGTPTVVLWDDFDLAAYRGRVVLVDVGATWCGPCAIEVEELKAVRQTFSEDELAIVSVFYDFRDNPSIVAEYARQHNITWDLVYGRDAFELFPVPLYPTLFILDKNLKPALRHVGIASSQDTIKDVRSLLEQ